MQPHALGEGDGEREGGERSVRRGMHEDYGKGYQVRGEEEAGG